MSSVNKVILVGNLGADPEFRSFQNGGKVANLRIATSQKWVDKQSGERKDRTEWHRVAIYNEGIAKVAEQYLKKGSKVYIEGQLETKKWTDQAGVERYTTEVVLRPFKGELTLLDAKDQSQGDTGGYDSKPQGQTGGAPAGGGYDDMSDHIPFSPQFL